MGVKSISSLKLCLGEMSVWFKLMWVDGKMGCVSGYFGAM